MISPIVTRTTSTVANGKSNLLRHRVENDEMHHDLEMCWTSWLFFVKPSEDGKPSLLGWPNKQNVDATVLGLTWYHNSYLKSVVCILKYKRTSAKLRKSGDSTTGTCGQRFVDLVTRVAPRTLY